MKLKETPQGVVLDVYVKPNSREFRLEIDEDTVIVWCPKAPVKGKLNKELLKNFSRLLGCRVELVSGYTSRQKKLLISDTDTNKINQIITCASNTL